MTDQQHECAEPNCVICQWVGERIMRFNDEMKAAILASAEGLTVEYRRWSPGDPSLTEESSIGL